MSIAPRVLVVGAGMAGLGAAYTLRKRELNNTVLESESYAGGRVKTERVEGFRINVGANLFVETYDTIRQVAEELGVPLKRTRVPIHGGPYHNGKFHGIYGGNSLASRWKTARTFLSFQLLSPKGLWQAIKLQRILKARDGDLSFDDVSGMLDLDDWGSVAAFFEANIGSELLERFFQPALSGFTFGYPEEVGTANALAEAWHFGLNGIAWPSIPEQGPGEFADALAGACQGNIRLSTPVKRIVVEDGAVKGVFTRGDEFLEADAVICATTATTALAITPGLPSDIGDALRQATYSRCCRVVFGLDTNPLPQDWYAVAFPRGEDTLIAGMASSGVLMPDSVPEGKALLHAFVARENAEELFAMSDDEAANRVIEEAGRYFPSMPAQPIFTRVYRWHEAVCLAPAGMMKAMSEMRRRSRSSVKGLFFAGEYMGKPSTNGALRSGIVAAEDCAEFLAGKTQER